MKSTRTHFVHQTAKAVLLTTVALTLVMPAGFAGAEAVNTSAKTVLAQAAGEKQAEPVSAVDPAKVKFTQEQAVAKIKDLFPLLKDATVSNVQLGITNQFPLPQNQMVWSIQWQYSIGNGSYGFSSVVDAITGDLISTYIYFPVVDNQSYYPPKFSQEQALEKAKAFVAKAAPSIKSSDLQLDDSTSVYQNNAALFGPIQYFYNFHIMKNGVFSTADNLMVVVDGNGNIMQFDKQGDNLGYPSATPKVTLEQANKSFQDTFDVGLYYIPIYKQGVVSSWVLGWRPVEEALYSIDAQTGKRVDMLGNESTLVPVTYKDVPLGKNIYKPLSSGKELTGEEAAKLVSLVAKIPADHKLISQIQDNDYMNKDRKIWRLTWGKNDRYLGGFPSQSYAEVDSKTGEILQFQVEQYSYGITDKPQTAPAAGKKLSQKEAKQKALDLVNRLYDKASTKLKYVDHGGNWEVNPDKTGYRYQFAQFYKGIPVADSVLSLNLDFTGNILSYSIPRITGIEKVTQEPVPVITKKEALARFFSQYKLKLQYNRTGGFATNSGYITPKIKLVYSPSPLDIQKSLEILDAITGKGVTVYEMPAAKGALAATDIKGHSAEKELSELLKYNVISLDAQGKVNPDQDITVGDWITFIVKASTPYYEGYNYNIGTERKAAAGVNPDNPYYSAVSFAAERGWVNKDSVLQVDSKLTREQLAVLLTAFVKYNKISVFLEKDSTVNQFSDSSIISNKGAVAIAVKLGLMTDDHGKFNPQVNVTKAQAATVIMKLVELQGKTDQMLGQQ